MLTRLGLAALLLFTGRFSVQADTNNAPEPDLVVRLELDSPKVKLGEPVSGRVVFTNNSPVEIKLFYPGFCTSNSLSTFGARVEGVRPDGKPRIVCARLVDEAETQCETSLVKSGELIGAQSADAELLEIQADLSGDEMVEKVAIPPGQEHKFDFRFKDCTELIPNYFEYDAKGRSLGDDPVFFIGTYELVFKYESKSVATEKSWLGKLQALPVRFEVQADK